MFSTSQDSLSFWSTFFRLPRRASRSGLMLFFLFSLAIPVSASEVIFHRDYVVSDSGAGEESVQVELIARNDAVVVRDAPGNPELLYVFTKTDAAITIAKYEEQGGYAHGIAYWVNDEDRVFVLYSFNKNGTYDLPAFQANTTLRIQLYRFALFIRDYIYPQYRFETIKDASGPTFGITPEPGAYTSASVLAIPSDGGVGMASDAGAVTTYAVTRTSTGEFVARGAGTRVLLEEEGTFDLSFTASDLLGNRASSSYSYTIDHSPPVMFGVTTSALPRADGSLDVALQFELADGGVGVALPSLAVKVSEKDGPTREFNDADLTIASGSVGAISVSLPILVVPRSVRLGLHVVAEDAIGNTLESNDTSFSLAMPPPALSASVVAAGIAAEVVEEGQALVPRYRVPIAIDRPPDELLSDGVARYRLTRRIESTGIVETAADLAAKDFVSRVADQDGHAVYWDVLQGSAYAHQSFTYEIETFFTVNGSETAQVAGVAHMPNIEAWQVELFAGETSLQAYRSGVVRYPEVRIKSLEGVTARIGPDPEGDALAMRLEYLGPGGIFGSVPADDWSRQIVLIDAIPDAPDGVYQIRFLIDEVGNDVHQSTPTYTVRVDRNYDEISGLVEWTSDLVVSGSIVIQSGATLRVAENVQVTVARVVELGPEGDPLPGGSPTITVRAGGRLELCPGSAFQPMHWQAGQQPGSGWEYWGGLVAEGHVLVTSGAIRGAIRGVTAISGSSVILLGAWIERCRTGMHAIGSTAHPVISASRFISNARYGIKEDSGASPVVTDCVFESNTCDYYDEELTVVEAWGINALAPGNNFGNTSSEGMP
jgi:hypothetical protein